MKHASAKRLTEQEEGAPDSGSPADAGRPADAVSADDARIMRQLQTAVWVYDIDSFRIVLANDAALFIWQAESEAELAARDYKEGMSATVQERLRQYQRDFSERTCTFSEMWTVYPNGKPTSVKVILSGYRLPNGRMAMLCEVGSLVEDTPENVRSSEALLHTDVMITLYGEDGAPLYMNPAARKSAQSAHESFRSRFVVAEDHDDICMTLEERGETRKVTRIKTCAGVAWHDMSAKKCLDGVTGEPAILVTSIDVSELKTARDRARYLADCDQLTGCFNRAYFNRHLDQVLSAPRRTPLALAFFDLDRFKHINDNFGHEIGDEILRVSTSRVLACLTEEDTLARFGGDEFVILLSTGPDRSSVTRRVEAIRTAIKQPIVHKAARYLVSASIGVVIVAEDAKDAAECIRRADIALYAAKQAGRDTFLIFDEAMGRRASERLRLEREIKEGLQSGQFELYYQPRVDAASGRVVSVEALARWNHPTRGLISPGVFIPICEETGMIEDLGAVVLEMGCQQIGKWRKAGLDVSMSINISPRQFLDPRLMETITALSRAEDFPAGSVELEITETVLVGDLDMITNRLKEITSLGFRIAIDDFGTGYSNLAYISRFPLDCLKIDKSFVDQLPTSGPVIRLIQTLADQIGASTVAEGVETEQQAEHLKAAGCTELQGFYYSKPLPAGEVLPRIHKLLGHAQQSNAGDPASAQETP
ncbi:MAG: EAL domain-containing protein [Pseudomonadota bacterium]